MARFYGPIGFVIDTHPSVDVTVEKPMERFYKGDIVKNYRKLEAGIGLNDDVIISNQISIVADPYAFSHIFAMRYVKWMNTAWKIVNVEVVYPRLILSLGGVYNGETKK